jgi:ankyrin repeat protein
MTKKPMILRVWLIGALALNSLACHSSTVAWGGKTPADMFKDAKEVALVEAATGGDAAKVKSVASHGGNVNAVSSEGPSPLLWAIHADNLAGVRALLEAGADPNLRMDPLDGLTALEVVISNGHSEMLRLMLAHGADPNLVPSDRAAERSLLATAAFEGYLENVKLLVQAGAEINFRDEHHQSAVQAAIDGGHYEVVLYLLEHGFNTALDQVAADTQTSKVSAEREPDRQKVINWLQAHGVKYPSYPETGNPR